MLTQVTSVIEKNDIIMPEVDLANVHRLVTRLIDFEKAGQMSFDDIANLQALLPDAAGGYGFETGLVLESTSGNFVLGHEALSSGMKATLLAVLTAAIAVILRFFRSRKVGATGGRRTSGSSDGHGATDKKAEKGTKAFGLACKQEIAKTSPVFDTQIEEFQNLINEYRSSGMLQTLDGDVHPELLSLMGSLYKYTKNFTNMPIPEFERSRDKARIGEILNTYAEALSLGRLQYQWIQPFNYFFMTDRDLYPHLRFLEEMFRFLKRNRSFETTIPDITIAISHMRFQPTREKDFQAPGAREGIDEIFRIIENDWAPKDMAKAVGLQVSARSNFDTFIEILEKLQEHTKAIFGTDLYESGPGDDKFKQSRMQAYYDFLTKDMNNPVAETWNAIGELVDQCYDLLKIAEGVMTKGGKVDFLTEAKYVTSELKSQYDRDMTYGRKDFKNFSEEEIQNLADLKDIGVFVTALVRFVAEFTRIVEYTTRFDEKLEDLEAKMTNFTKVLIQVNQVLKKVQE